VGSYIHSNGKIGVLVEVNCETDFVARTDEFQRLVRDIAMHVAAADPIAVEREGLDSALVASEKEMMMAPLRQGHGSKGLRRGQGGRR
jgi:elongation factor Ts